MVRQCDAGSYEHYPKDYWTECPICGEMINHNHCPDCEIEEEHDSW